MKGLVTYYTRTGNTKVVANAIAEKLGCNIEEIVDNKKRTGLIGSAGAYLNPKAETTVKDMKTDPKNYDMVIIGTPIWWYTCAPAVTAYLDKYEGGIKKAAFFYTCGANAKIKAFSDMEKMLGQAPVATLGIEVGAIKNDTYDKNVDKFVKKIQK